ncbi:MAG TPA: TonB-dependent receptor [Candidatus Acidoferrum sp.]|nr:TonB-dependent receptor [Candidatus Acidoferrum sp.]
MKRKLGALALLAFSFGWIAVAMPCPARAAEATTGTIAGSVASPSGQPLSGVHVVATSPSGRSTATTDARGRFTILGLAPDSYTISAESPGYEIAAQAGITVLPGQTQQLAIRLAGALRTIGSVKATSNAFVVGSPSDTFTVSGEAARARTPPVSSSGLANYTAGTVQGAIASVPGIDLDPFANAILRGGKIDDAVFEYDSVPIPQGLIAEPGGNVVGAQLPTTGIASTNVNLAGYEAQGDNALGGVIDQIPAVGTYPGKTSLELGNGIGPAYRSADLQILTATPDLKWRYALSSSFGSEYFSYGDGRSFYPAEAATYGLALQNRSHDSTSGNIHYRLTPNDDLSVLGLVGQATYDQYGSPYAGQTFGAFDGSVLTYPGEINPNAPVTFPSRVRGNYDVIKAQWLHTGERSLSRVQLYESRFGSTAGGPFWDENGFPNGPISLFAQQGGRQAGIGYDGDVVPSDRHHLRFGGEYRITTSFLDQIVPTADEVITSHPTLHSYLAYFGDTWSVSPRLDLMATGRLTGTHVVPSDGFAYDVGALDPHLSAAYKLGGRAALRASFDHTTVAPKPLQVDRVDSTNVDANGNPAPFVPLAPETANDFTYSFESNGRTQVRATYYANFEKNRIDVLPFNFRSAVAAGTAPGGVGVPTNVGELRVHGVELWLKNGGFTLDTNYARGFSSSASQFAYNSLNAAAVAAGHLFPVGYIPDLTSTLSYQFETAKRRVRIAPSISFQTGYPYGNGRMIWIFDANGKPVQVPNDNHVNPGYNYYFLRDPSQAFNAATNPYIGSLGTPEGNDPNTLHTPSQTLVNLHIEGDVSPRLTLMVDVVNLLGNFSPTAYQGNPYLIGPPGYTGGNPLYAVAYQNAAGVAQPYTLGNGVPTSNGTTQAVPWTYGTAGYVPQSYPLGRSLQIRLRYRI